MFSDADYINAFLLTATTVIGTLSLVRLRTFLRPIRSMDQVTTTLINQNRKLHGLFISVNDSDNVTT
jgi:hypothetical protein